MQILFSELATQSLKEISDYFTGVAGKRVAQKIIRELLVATKQLKDYPKSGQIQENLIELELNHRYIIALNHKIIYREVIEGILVTDIFNCKQDPNFMNQSSRFIR